MKIQLQHNSFYPNKGGIETYLYYLSREFFALGHKIEILTYRVGDAACEEYFGGIKVIRKEPFWPPSSNSGFTKVLSRLLSLANYPLRKYLKEELIGVDLVLSRSAEFCYATRQVAPNIPLIYIPAVVTPRYAKYEGVNIPFINKIYSMLIKIPRLFWVEREALKKCDGIVTISNVRKNELSDFYKIPSERFKVIPPGVDTERFIQRKKDIQLLKELKIDNDAEVILTVCRLAPKKNITMLLNAFSKMNLKKLNLVIVGDGVEKESLIRLSRKLFIDEKVRFVGFRDDVERFYSIADLFILPSIYEGFGHVFLEAMASGVPCMGLKENYPDIIVATSEIIIDGKTGYIVDPHPIDNIISKIEIILRDEKLRKNMGENARKICEEKYSWKLHVQNLLTIYKKIKEKAPNENKD